MRPTYLSTLLAVAILIGAAGRAYAQVARSGGGQNAQLAQQYQQAVTDHDQLQAQNDKLKKDFDDVKKQLETAKQQSTGLKSAVGTTAAQLAAAQAANQATTHTLEQTKNQMQDLINHYRDTAATLSGVEKERSQLQQQLAQSKAAFDQCAVRNYQLYQVDDEVLDRYEHQSAFNYVARAEPFTRLTLTRIENLVDEYRQRAEELRVPGASLTPGANSTSSASSAPKH